MLTLAIPKGRLLKQALPLLKAGGIAPTVDIADDRRIMLPTTNPAVRLIVVRAADVQTYVASGTAQVGLLGRDMLLESPREGIYHAGKTKLGKCRLVVAGPRDFDFSAQAQRSNLLVVASKYPRLARAYFANEGLPAKIIRLYGSMELAPLVGIADVIVDLVETGLTLAANNLVELVTIMPISTEVIVNQVASLRQQPNLSEVVAKLKAS